MGTGSRVPGPGFSVEARQSPRRFRGRCLPASCVSPRYQGGPLDARWIQTRAPCRCRPYSSRRGRLPESRLETTPSGARGRLLRACRDIVREVASLASEYRAPTVGSPAPQRRIRAVHRCAREGHTRFAQTWRQMADWDGPRRTLRHLVIHLFRCVERTGETRVVRVDWRGPNVATKTGRTATAARCMVTTLDPAQRNAKPLVLPSHGFCSSDGASM